MDIVIKNLSVSGCHGVLDTEKTHPQKFVIDMTLTLGNEKASYSDKLDDTVSYSDVCNMITDIIEKESYQLIEKIAGTIADRVMNTYRKIDAAEIEVKKTNPPMKGTFDYMAVRLKRVR